MLSLGGNHRVFLCVKPVDFRKAHDGLCAIIRDTFRDDPFTGDVFVFHNGARDRVKLLLWDRNGFWLLYKRLEQGTFPFDVRGDGERVEIDRAQLSMLLEGLEWKSAKKSWHFTRRVAIQGRDGTRS
ncbi:MAG: IS66 family insertion sequence element accessory protein TnpB [Gemmatimonadetes bacterium]|nr:IS66 family insertion sequence element accessory protein TnpB [Gemmatimonadota bacterium]